MKVATLQGRSYNSTQTFGVRKPFLGTTVGELSDNIANKASRISNAKPEEVLMSKVIEGFDRKRTLSSVLYELVITVGMGMDDLLRRAFAKTDRSIHQLFVETCDKIFDVQLTDKNSPIDNDKQENEDDFFMMEPELPGGVPISALGKFDFVTMLKKGSSIEQTETQQQAQSPVSESCDLDKGNLSSDTNLKNDLSELGIKPIKHPKTRLRHAHKYNTEQLCKMVSSCIELGKKKGFCMISYSVVGKAHKYLKNNLGIDCSPSTLGNYIYAINKLTTYYQIFIKQPTDKKTLTEFHKFVVENDTRGSSRPIYDNFEVFKHTIITLNKKFSQHNL